LVDRVLMGGVEKIAIEEVDAFRRQGIDAQLLVLSRNYTMPEGFSDLLRNVPIVHLSDRLPRLLRFDFKMPLFHFFSFFHISSPFLLPFVVKEREYDFIISHNSYTSFTALTLSKFKKIPYGMYVHDPISYILRHGYKDAWRRFIFLMGLPLAVWFDKLLLNNAEAVFVQGQDHFELLHRLMKNPEKQHYITPGHDIVEPKNKKRGDFFLAASAWKEGKNIEGLISLLQHCKQAKLIIAGKWIHADYKLKVETFIDRNNLGGRVTILGEVTEAKLNELYATARAAIIYSNEKGFGMTSLEAAANGTTFIIPDSCGAARCFSSGIDGFLYRFGDDRQLVSYMQRLEEDFELAEIMGQHAKLRVEKNYSWKKHTNILTSNMRSAPFSAFKDESIDVITE
jgi:glycosyltransferase involved in cell wall biosynthesis